jgi:hypothetical protein
MELNFNIFISHDSKDETVAVELKSFLENIFLNSTVYVSGRDLQGGQTWIENIKLSLKNSQVIISIITKESINNNWIYFETGAGFTDDKSIPLITDGLKFGDLKPPLNLLQARTLSKQGIESLVNDISNKLGLRTPKLLTGIEKLIEEAERFFKMRNTEKKVVAAEPISLPQKQSKIVSKNTDSNVDPEIKQQYDIAVDRALNLTRSKILSVKDKYDLPTEEELNKYDFDKLQNISQAYNIPYPGSAFTNLLILRLNPLPNVDAAKWEKLNVSKRISEANAVLDKFEKTI